MCIFHRRQAAKVQDFVIFARKNTFR